MKPSNKIRSYLLRAQEWGLGAESVLQSSGLTWGDLNAAENFDLETADRLFDLISHRMPADFAIRCGLATKVRDFGIVGLAMESMPTLRDAFRLWNRYSLVAGQPFIASITETEDQWRMHFVPRRRMTPMAQWFCLEVCVAALEVIIKELTGSPARTLGVDFPFDRPASLERFARLRTGNLRFGCGAASYCGCRADLDLAIPDADREISEALQEECERFLADLGQPRLIGQRLGDVIRSSSGRTPSLEELAKSMGVSSRSLQRDLNREGITYQELVKRIRHEHALELLKLNRRNIKEIAHILGFHDVGSFRRAFREWTGHSVTEWQKLHASQEVRGAGSCGSPDRAIQPPVSQIQL